MARKKKEHPADGVFYVTADMISENSCSYALSQFRDRFGDAQIPVTMAFLRDMVDSLSGASYYWMWDRIEHIASEEQREAFWGAEDTTGEAARMIMDVLADYARSNNIARLPKVKPPRLRRYEVSLSGVFEATSARLAARQFVRDNNLDMINVDVREVRGGRAHATRRSPVTDVYVDL